MVQARLGVESSEASFNVQIGLRVPTASKKPFVSEMVVTPLDCTC